VRRALLAAALALLGAAPAQAATFQVNTTADSPTCNAITCSLRGAITSAQANGATEDDVINVPAGIYATQEVTTNATRLTILGAGANSTIWQPAGANRLLTVNGGGNVAINNLTFRNGVTTGNGGNVFVQSSTLSLTGVRVTGGQAISGGGIYVEGPSNTTVLNAFASLVDHNTSTGTTGTQGGGGLYLEGATFQPVATLVNSTVAFNTAARGGAVGGAFGSTLNARGATIAFNTSTLAGTFALQPGTAAVATFQGSIIARNTSVAAGAPVTVTANCAAALVGTDQGGNVEDTNQCDLTAASRTGADPQLAAALDETQQPPTLAIPKSSPAFDFADCGGRTTDQRGQVRPLGAACDAGAFELDPRPDTAVQGAAPPFSFTASEPGTTFQCALDGGEFAPCAAPYDPGAAPGTHTLRVRAVDSRGNADPTPATVTFTVAAPPTPTPTPTATPNPTPVAGRTVVIRETKGTVKVKRPGRKTFENVDAAEGIPVGSTVDTRKGTVELTSVPRAGAPPETAKFFDGLFKISQSHGITTLTLTEALARCPKRGHAAAAAKKPKKRKLWGDGKGRFRTKGKYSAATIRGTRWLVTDSCAGTKTTVRVGVVEVRDNVLHRTKIVRAGKSYLARPRRR
jgi:CSLREA domain-containing protein